MNTASRKLSVSRIAAGNDLAMICHRVDQIGEAREVLENLPAARNRSRARECRAFQETDRAAGSIFRREIPRARRGIWDLRVAVLGEESAAERSPEDGNRSPVEIY